MDRLDWDTPPTEEELKSAGIDTAKETKDVATSFDTPPTEEELVYLKDVVLDTKKEDSLALKKRKLEELKIDNEIAKLEGTFKTFDNLQVVKDVKSAGKGVIGQIGSLASSIPANIAEAVGMDADEIRKSQKYWQDLTQEARDELTATYGDSEIAKSMLFATANPMSYSGQSILSMIGIGGTEKAMEIASQGDRSGVTMSDAGDVASSSAFAGAVGKAIDAITPAVKAGKTRFGNLIDRLPEDERVAASKALDTLDSMSIKKLNPEARDRIIKNIGVDSVDDVNVNQKVIKALGEEIKKSKDNYTKAYEEAYAVAKDAGKVDLGDILSQVRTNKYGDLDAPLKGDAEATNAYKNIVTLVGKNKVVDANEMEKMLTVLKDKMMSAEGSTSLYYQRAIDAISKKQDSLLQDAGIDGVYKNARELWTKHKLDFEGNVFGGQLPTGATAGKAIDTAIKSQDNYGLTKKLLGTNIDANIAEGLVTKISQTQRKDMVFSYMVNGTNKSEPLSSPDNVEKFLSNWRAARTGSGLEMMLGKEEFASINKMVNALDFTNKAIKGASKEDLSIGKDVLEMTAAVAAAKISPYAAVHVSINKAKTILDKKLLKQEGGMIIKRIKDVKDTQLRNKLLKATYQIMRTEPLGEVKEEE